MRCHNSMNCITSAALGFALLGGSIMTLSVDEEKHEYLRTKFSGDLAEKHENIVRERRNHYIQGLFLGLLVSFFISFHFKTVNRFYKMMMFTAVTLGVGVLYYLLMPKSDWMLLHLKTADENKAWLEVYKTMKQRYLIGMILGAAAAVPFANALC